MTDNPVDAYVLRAQVLASKTCCEDYILGGWFIPYGLLSERAGAKDGASSERTIEKAGLP